MRNPFYLIVSVLVTLPFGILCGAVLQKYWGLGNLLTITSLGSGISSAPVLTSPHALGDTSAGIPEELHGKLSLFILAGQSNMSGLGKLPPEQLTDPRVFMFGNDYRWKIAREPIDAPTGQVDEVSQDNDAGFGPGLAFATSLLKYRPGMAIGLIPCAKASSSIGEWQRNLSENTLYGSCLKRIQAATTVGTIAGLLFFQGEDDAIDPNRFPNRSLSAFAYATQFSTFVNDLRRDVSLPQLPVVFAQIATHTAPQYFINWHIIKEQQEMIVLPCAAMITTDDLPLGDGLHFTTESYQIIGERYAKAMFNLTAAVPECGRK